jgi:multiple sugar transport system substrate-binding protein
MIRDPAGALTAGGTVIAHRDLASTIQRGLTMTLQHPASTSRRQFLKTVGMGSIALAGLAPLIHTRRASAQPKTLKILQWSHFVPRYDEWFDKKFTKEWGDAHSTQVVVDHISSAEIRARAAAEVAAQKGHDLFMFLDPPAIYEAQVIEHNEIIQEIEGKYGKMVDLAQKSTFNPKTKKYFGVSDNWVPDPGNYRRDLWDAVGVFPDTWDNVRVGGAKIKEQAGNPVGIGLSQELDTSMAMRAIMYSFGSHEQNEEGQLTINSKATLEAVKFVRALYKETMTPEVFTWDVSSNNRFMLAGKGSFAMNAISITRSAEKDVPEMSKKIQLSKTPAGPVRRMGLEHVMGVYVIWKFAENKDGAKQFLLDLIDNYRTAFLESEFYNFPSFPNTVPDLQELIAQDPKADPPDKYKILGDFINNATNVGYPGYSTAAIDEVFSTFVIPTMFAKAARDELSPEDAVKAAEREMKRIFAKWERA